MTGMVWKVLGTAAAVAAGAVACAVVDRGLRRLEEKIEADRAAAADTAQPAGESVPPQPADAPAAPAEAAASGWGSSVPHFSEPSGRTAADLGENNAEAQLRALLDQIKTANATESAPNPNPVMAPPAEAPKTPEGKVDVEKLCAAEDFCDWEDLGCQG